ncbi:Alpha/Beta hydrolase protein [Phascolomyces articulosus]|uniref:Alpha/Beta hydrolase protein n=1 Tax=Phascolomyces articulosus TaxID=60185 RepID=A0AAD5KB84_9FUNG|nr:Alpha/Beta hydrolase protein [Phascolomyces articulosus]
MFLFIWFLLELTFWLYIRQTWIRLQQRVKPHGLPSFEERWRLYWNCIHTMKDENFEDWVTGWCYLKDSPRREHPKFSEIYKENLATLLAWAFWGEDLETVQSNVIYAAELEKMVHNLEVIFSVKFPTGYNPHVQCIRPPLDSFKYIHRPLILYLGNFVFTTLFNYLFLEKFAKFRSYGTDRPGVRWGSLFNLFLSTTSTATNTAKHQHLVYWYREGKRTPSTNSYDNNITPIIFIHGIGTGLHLYMDFIRRIISLEQPVFCIELPHVSSRLVEHIPTPQETVGEIQTMLNTHKYTKATIVGHSLGTIVAGWMAKFATHRVSGLVLIDPICFLLNFHYTAYNMLHRVPSKFTEYLIHYVASRELYINYYFHRHFHWYQNVFFIRDTPTSNTPLFSTPIATQKIEEENDPKNQLYNNTTVYLSECDVIVNAQQIEKYLKKRTIDTTMMKNMEHAGYLTQPVWLQRILSDIEDMVSSPTTSTKEIDEAIAI